MFHDAFAGRIRRGQPSRRRPRGQEVGPCFLEDGQDLLLGDGGKVVEERADRVAALQVIKEGSHRHSGPAEYWRAAENVWTLGDLAFHSITISETRAGVNRSADLG